MTLPSINYYHGIKILLRQIDAPNTTKTVYFTDRPNKAATADATPYWPILLSVSEFGAQMDEFLPKPFSGSFTIDDSVGTFGEGRKFSDLLERYTAIHQSVEIHIDAIALESEAISLDSDSRAWIARVASIQLSPENEQSTITFNLTQDPIPDQQLCLMIGESTVAINAPNQQGAGKWLPIAAGAYNYLPAYSYTANASTRFYGYATNYGSKFIHQVTGVYSRDIDGKWCAITSAISSAYSLGGGSASYSYDPTINPEYVFAIKNTSSYNGIITGVKFEMDPNGGGAHSSACTMTISVYECTTSSGELSLKRLAICNPLLAAYNTQNNAGSNFDIYARFDRAVTLNWESKGYAIGVSSTGWKSGESSILKCASDTCQVWRRGISANYVGLGTIAAPAMTCYYTTATTNTSSTYDAEGKAIAGVILEAANAYVVPTDLWENTDIIVKTAGLLDSVGGDVTGSNRGELSRPDQFIEALSYSGDSTNTWTASTDWDWSTYASAYATNYASSGQNARLLLGYQDAPVTYRQMLEGVCRDTASRIGIKSNGTLFLWPWGHSALPSFTIPPEDIIPVSWSIGDTSSIINRVRLTYGVTNVDIVAFRNKKQKSNYTGTYDRTLPFRGVAESLASNSVLAFGRRELEMSETEYVGDSVSAQTMLDYYMIRYARPLMLAEIDVPYHKYSTLNLLAIINFAHPAFPKYDGASPRHGEPYEQESDVTRAFLKGGRHWHAVKYWRGQVERWSVDKPSGVAPRMKLLLRVLPNYPTDPT